MVFFLFILFIAFFAATGLGVWLYKQYSIGASSLSNKKILDIAEGLGGSLTVEDVCESSGLTRGEARIKLYTMLAQGIFEYNYDNVTLQEVFIFSPSTRKKMKYAEEPHRPNQKFNNRLSDGEIISFAVNAKGKISSASLCIKADISVDEAKKRLNDLHEKGIFEIKVTENGTVTYIINDLDLPEGD